MSYLVDTSVLVRLANIDDALHEIAARATAELHQQGQVLVVAPQCLVEFRNVATRPLALNGLGLAAVEAEAKAARYERTFPLLPETPDIFPAWKALVEALVIVGKQVHDARLVAVCHVHGVTHLLSFNARHFARMAGHGPGIVVVDPGSN